MANTLKEHFSIIRERSEVIEDIYKSKKLIDIFESWNKEQQDEFLDFCTGVRGIKLLYDTFFKEIINPDTTPERLEELLSLLLKMKVKILKVLPNDSARIAAESSLLILDIVVELEDGSIANVEAQKIGYAFPGERSACYSADLLLRQYKRIKSQKKKKFSYRNIKKVYTIVFIEKSSKEFHEFSGEYIHYMKQTSNTGLQLNLLQEYIFIPLDMFRKKLDNNSANITNELEAWLTFLSVDEPEIIVDLLEKYPQFEVFYRDVYEMCRNTEKVMNMFSKELAELDKNTVQYMIDEMQDTIDLQKDTIEAQKNKIKELEALLKEKEIEE